MRNPPWHRDELILALDLYFRHNPAHIGAGHAEVRALSKILNALPIHARKPDAARFRNPNGVYMKLCNFLRMDPDYKGKGLQAGGALEEEVWSEFAHDRPRLAQTADAIRQRLKGTGPEETVTSPEDDEEAFPEGRVLFRAHRSRERNRTLVERAKQTALKRDGQLACQVCAFDFKHRYGELGEGYIECHHVLPISQIPPGAKTKVSDLALLCANCHRMIHRRRPWLSMGDLGVLVGPTS